jgi:hypothetical protein
LKRVLRRDRHDREDIWFVSPDGGNLVEMVDDAVRTIRADGPAWFEKTRIAADGPDSAAG